MEVLTIFHVIETSLGLIAVTVRSVGWSGKGRHVAPSPAKPVRHVQVYEPLHEREKSCF